MVGQKPTPRYSGIPRISDKVHVTRTYFETKESFRILIVKPHGEREGKYRCPLSCEQAMEHLQKWVACAGEEEKVNPTGHERTNSTLKLT